MSFSIHLENLDRLSGELGEVAQIFRELEQFVATVPLDAKDPKSIEAAITAADNEIDRRTLPFGANDAVAQIAGQFKEKAADAIRLRAEQEA